MNNLTVSSDFFSCSITNSIELVSEEINLDDHFEKLKFLIFHCDNLIFVLFCFFFVHFVKNKFNKMSGNDVIVSIEFYNEK